MPIEVDEDLIGVVVLVRQEPEPFAGAHIALVETFADQPAIAVAIARPIDAVERQRTQPSRFVSPQVRRLRVRGDARNCLDLSVEARHCCSGPPRAGLLHCAGLIYAAARTKVSIS